MHELLAINVLVLVVIVAVAFGVLLFGKRRRVPRRGTRADIARQLGELRRAPRPAGRALVAIEGAEDLIGLRVVDDEGTTEIELPLVTAKQRRREVRAWRSLEGLGLRTHVCATAEGPRFLYAYSAGSDEVVAEQLSQILEEVFGATRRTRLLFWGAELGS